MILKKTWLKSLKYWKMNSPLSTLPKMKNICASQLWQNPSLYWLFLKAFSQALGSSLWYIFTSWKTTRSSSYSSLTIYLRKMIFNIFKRYKLNFEIYIYKTGSKNELCNIDIINLIKIEGKSFLKKYLSFNN